MIPYADFTYFVLLVYVAVPTLILGLLGRAGWRWALLVTVAMLLVQYHEELHVRAHFPVREIWILLGFAAPLVSPKSQFGFLGISYVTFRALDVVFCLRDQVIAAPGTLDLLMFLFFFPTISAGPIDRYRRFLTDWKKKRTRTEFLSDLDGAVHRFFRGLFYKFIVAALIKQHWLEPAARSGSFGALLSYMYAYSFYLFFDFAGYSAFAISLSYLFGVLVSRSCLHAVPAFRRPRQMV